MCDSAKLHRYADKLLKIPEENLGISKLSKISNSKKCTLLSNFVV